MKGRYLVAAFGVIQSELITVLNREIEDRAIAIDCIRAWSKLLALHLISSSQSMARRKKTRIGISRAATFKTNDAFLEETLEEN